MSNSETLKEVIEEQKDCLNNNDKFYVDSGRGFSGLKVGSIQHTIYDVPSKVIMTMMKLHFFIAMELIMEI